ncbi:MAG: TRAP transporter large permease subunit [Geminicoccaceae bacterium]
MFAVLAMLLFSGFPVAFVLGGVGLAFGFIGIYFDVFSVIEFFNIAPRIWGGVAENLVLVAVPMFVFMGTMLERSGVAKDLLECLEILLRRVPGGLALSVTLMGTIMAATTGIIGASVVMMSLLALPVMLNSKYSPPLATGTICASGTLGILIPPSIMLVLMADLLSISVGTLFMAAVIPGFLLSGFYYLYIYGLCHFRPQLAPLPDHLEIDSKGPVVVMVLKSFLPPVFLIVLVLGSIFGGWATPTEAAGVGAAGAVLLAIFNRTLNLQTLKEVVHRTAITNAMIFGIFVGATCFSYVFRSLGGDFIVEDLILDSGLGDWGVLILIMAVVFALGFFFDWLEITLIVLPVFAPIVSQLSSFADHVGSASAIVPWFAIVIAVNLQTSFLTPPFGFALFYLKGVAPPSVKIQQIYLGIIPFVLLQLLGLAMVIAFPQIAMWLPTTLLD